MMKHRLPTDGSSWNEPPGWCSEELPTNWYSWKQLVLKLHAVVVVGAVNEEEHSVAFVG